MTYLVSYDLSKPERDYFDLLAALRNADAVRILFSQWLVSAATTSAMDVLNHFRQHIDADDRMFVCQVNANWAYINIMNIPEARRLLP